MSAAPYRLPRRSITSVQLLTQLGLDHGLSVERCLHNTGLSPCSWPSYTVKSKGRRSCS